jgi:hypothetical protein
MVIRALLWSSVNYMKDLLRTFCYFPINIGIFLELWTSMVCPIYSLDSEGLSFAMLKAVNNGIPEKYH